MAYTGRKSRSGKKRRSSAAKIIFWLAVLVALVLVGAHYSGGVDAVFHPKAENATPSGAKAPASPSASEELMGALNVYVIDVGQGDSILLVSPSGETMLIDAGESKYFDTVDALLSDLGIERLDVAVATHPHSDHIGAMAEIIKNYPIGTFYLPDKEHTSKTFENMLDALEKNHVTTVAAAADGGAFIRWDDAVSVQILSPFSDADYGDNLNDYSVVLHVIYGGTSILLTGDAEGEDEGSAEAVMLSRLPKSCFSSTVLKVGHHGSSTSTSDAFLKAVSPEIAVISVGEGNSYGHPDPKTLQKVASAGIPCYRTDESGTIHLIFDGSKVTVAASK